MNTAYFYPNQLTKPRIAFVSDVPKKGTSYSVSESFLYNLKGNAKAAGINLSNCLVCSVLDYYPGYVATGKDFDWSDPKAAKAVNSLEEELTNYNPDVIITLGSLSLNFFKPSSDQLDKERGAPFRDNKKNLIIPTYHPRDLFIEYSKTTLAVADMAKALRLAKEGWSKPEYNINYLPTYSDVISMLEKFIQHKAYLAVDIETTYSTGLCTCIGFAYSVKNAIVIPFVGRNGSGAYWSKEQEKVIWTLIAKTLKACPLVGHNAVHFDFEMLAKNHGIVSNFIDDTMFGIWSCYPEMPKSLSFCSSLFTDNPYWKDELKQARLGKIPRYKEFEYNGRDCIITMQAAKSISKEIKELGSDVRNHYKFNIRVSRAYEYMAMMGAYIDKRKLNDRITEVNAKCNYLQEQLNEAIGRKINVKSPKQVKEYLYGELKLPERKTSRKNKDGTLTETLTTDYLTTLYMARQYPDEPTISAIGNLRKLYKKLSWLNGLNFDDTNQCKWAFNVVGTETGRSTGYKPLNGKGVQPQNVNGEDRDLFIPPEGYDWCKADLEGADSVTVAACLEALGDKTLHEDIKKGIKPAQTLALAMIHGPHAMDWSAEEIKRLSKDLKKTESGKRSYDIAKRINHGSAYMLSPKGMHTNVFKFSDGELYVSPEECKASQDLLFRRYNYPAYHEQIRSMMHSDPTLKAASGQQRTFFGRPDNATQREMLAYLPQAHTAFVTNKTIESLYYSKDNRTGNGDLFLKLCNQVHDETVFYIPIGGELYAHELFYSVCEVPLRIWGVDFTIQFEANYGPSWGETETPL